MAKKSFWQRGEDYAKKVSGEIIDQIKAGVAPWQKPWKPGEQISAENFSTGKKYSGGNSLYLMSRAIRDGRGDNRWGTYNQIREAGGQVRKGEKGTQVLFFTDRNSRVAKDEKGQTMKNKEGKTIYEEQKREKPICKQYTVFNVEQAEGLELKPREGQVRPEWDAHRDAEKVIAASGPTVQHVAGDRAYYRMAEDKIVLPEQSRARRALHVGRPPPYPLRSRSIRTAPAGSSPSSTPPPGTPRTSPRPRNRWCRTCSTRRPPSRRRTRADPPPRRWPERRDPAPLPATPSVQRIRPNTCDRS